MAEFLGQSISKDVVDQLTRRSKYADKSNSLLEDGYKVQQFLSSRGVWVRLLSSVNEVDSIEELEPDNTNTFSVYEHSRYIAKADNTAVSLDLSGLGAVQETELPRPSKGRHFIKDIKSNSTLAKKFVLSGGELEWNGEKFVPRQGINFQPDPERKAYNYSDTLGVRPMPGITSFDIKCKNRFCSVRKATINFNVWSLEDFEAIQKLYFRPGYSVILEWGDSYYIDENEDLVEALQSEKKEDIKKYFSNSTFRELEDLINDKKEAYGTSYDSFIGYVDNFTWSFRKDGGYDCSISVVSKGSVIESITVDKDIRYNTSAKEGILPKGDNDYRNRSVFHYLLKTLQENTYQFSEEGLDFRDGNIQNMVKRVPITPFLEGYDSVNNFYPLEDKRMPVAMINTQITDPADDFFNRSESSKHFFITLRSFLRLINTYYLIKNQKSTKLEFSFDTLSKNRYLTFSNHFSISPLECFLPKTTVQSELKFLKYDDRQDNSLHIDPLSANLPLFYGVGTDLEILNIGVSLNTITSEIDKIIAKRASLEKKNLYDLINNILSIVQNNLGEINSFDIQISENNTATIVDRNFTYFEEYKDIERKTRNLRLSGITSLIETLEVQSTISSELSSQIAISAQNDTAPDGQVNLGFLGWNKGLIDRFTPTKTTTFIPDIQDTFPPNYDEKRESFISRLMQIFRQINHIRGSSGGYPIYVRKYYQKDKDIVNNLKSEFNIRTREALLSQLANDEKPLPGLIPITLKFTLDGISGFKIGEVFRIGSPSEPFKLLPDVYSIYSYVINGVDHSIQNNKWFTTVSAIPYKAQKTNSNKEIIKPGQY
jgi:hypothetical protein